MSGSDNDSDSSKTYLECEFELRAAHDLRLSESAELESPVAREHELGESFTR